MLPRTYDAQNCSLARSLEVVGERWTLLIEASRWTPSVRWWRAADYATESRNSAFPCSGGAP